MYVWRVVIYCLYVVLLTSFNRATDGASTTVLHKIQTARRERSESVAAVQKQDRSKLAPSSSSASASDALTSSNSEAPSPVVDLGRRESTSDTAAASHRSASRRRLRRDAGRRRQMAPAGDGGPEVGVYRRLPPHLYDYPSSDYYSLQRQHEARNHIIPASAALDAAAADEMRRNAEDDDQREMTDRHDDTQLQQQARDDDGDYGREEQDQVNEDEVINYWRRRLGAGYERPRRYFDSLGSAHILPMKRANVDEDGWWRHRRQQFDSLGSAMILPVKKDGLHLLDEGEDETGRRSASIRGDWIETVAQRFSGDSRLEPAERLLDKDEGRRTVIDVDDDDASVKRNFDSLGGGLILPVKRRVNAD